MTYRGRCWWWLIVNSIDDILQFIKSVIVAKYSPCKLAKLLKRLIRSIKLHVPQSNLAVIISLALTHHSKHMSHPFKPHFATMLPSFHEINLFWFLAKSEHNTNMVIVWVCFQPDLSAWWSVSLIQDQVKSISHGVQLSLWDLLMLVKAILSHQNIPSFPSLWLV